MRRSDYIFFGLIFLVFGTVITSILFGFSLPSYLMWWWVLLIPMIILFLLFPNSKITKWLNKK